MKKCTITSVLVLSVLAFSCKKDKDKSTSDKLQGKWNIVSAQWNDHVSGQDYIDSTTFLSGDGYLEFKSDSVYEKAGIAYSTRAYKVLDNGKLLMSTDTFSI